MTASVTIIVDQVEDALLVPNKAIRTSGGQQYVTVMFEGQQINVPVTVGLVGDSMSEITNDQLLEGDAVVVNGSTTSATASSNTGDRMFMMEGMGGPPAGMP